MGGKGGGGEGERRRDREDTFERELSENGSFSGRISIKEEGVMVQSVGVAEEQEQQQQQQQHEQQDKSGERGKGLGEKHGGEERACSEEANKVPEPGGKTDPVKRVESAPTIENQVKADLNIYAQRQAALQQRLANLTASLRKFEVKEKEGRKQMADFKSEVKEWYKHSTNAFNMSNSKVLGRSHILAVPADVMTHVLKHLPGRKIFVACTACKLFVDAQNDREFWTNRIQAEFREDPPQGASSVRAVKHVYSDRMTRWRRVEEQLEWLKAKNYPSDVNGTIAAGPWNRKALIASLHDLVEFTGPGAGQWRKDWTAGRLRCLCALLGSTHEGVQELSAAAIANVIGEGETETCGGRHALLRHNSIKPLQRALFSNCLGIQKQAARAMVNACAELANRVTVGGDSALLHLPWRRDEMLTNGRAEWLCVDFTPSGEPSQPYQIVLSLSPEGRLKGHGTDSLGSFELGEATLNRTLQWMSGSCVEKELGVSSGGVGAHDGVDGSYEAMRLKETAVSGAGASELLKIAGNSTPKELPGIIGKIAEATRAHSGAGPKRQGNLGFGEVVSRVAGFQARYNARSEGKVVSVAEGTEHVVFHKTYERRHGDDHVRMVAFSDRDGYWGFWERGRYQYQNKMEAATRGVFRMWQP